jgi:hypothetical protein
LVVGHHTGVNAATVTDDLLVATLTTGWGLWPRAAVGVDVSAGRIRFIYPFSGFSNGVRVSESQILLDNYTPANGARIRWPDGTVDTDAEVFVHMLSTDGTPSPYRGQLSQEAGRGGISFELFGKYPDGRARPIFRLDRFPPYAAGTPGIFVVRPDSRIERVVAGPQDSHCRRFSVILSEGREYLITRWSTEEIVRIYDTDFSLVAELDPMDSLRDMTIIDGRVHRLDLLDGTALLTDANSGQLYESFELAGEAVIGARFTDVDGHEPPEVLIRGEKQVVLFEAFTGHE